jgi:hypothetical protein
LLLNYSPRHEEVEARLHAFFTSALNWSKLLLSLPGRCNRGSHWTEGWVDLRCGTNATLWRGETPVSPLYET